MPRDSRWQIAAIRSDSNGNLSSLSSRLLCAGGSATAVECDSFLVAQSKLIWPFLPKEQRVIFLNPQRSRDLTAFLFEHAQNRRLLRSRVRNGLKTCRSLPRGPPQVNNPVASGVREHPRCFGARRCGSPSKSGLARSNASWRS